MNNLIIIKVKRNKNFATINLSALLDDRLSWRAKGLHTYLLSRPPDWKIWRNDLIKKSKDGVTSLNSAIKELKELKYLIVESNRKKDGTIEYHYIVCEEPDKPQNDPYIGLPLTVNPSTVNQHYSINDYSINDYSKKKEITNVISPTKLEDIEEIFKYYLKVANKMKKYLSENNIKSDKLTIHQNIYSKCTVSLPDNKDDAVSIPIIDIISEYLDSYSVDEFKTAIDNYYTVFISNLTEDKYWYKVIWKNIGSFIYSGVHRDTGFKSFLDLKKLIRGYNVNLPEIDQLRSEFKPITKEYKLNNIFDKEINTYYGFETDRFIDSSLMNEYESDVKHGYNNNKFSYGYFCYLEELIASIFWNRKAGYDLELLKALMSIWKEKKPEFKKTVLELR